jgi:hypothetical protein
MNLDGMSRIFECLVQLIVTDCLCGARCSADSTEAG